ncbi:DinB family protein [Flexivirga sp.]|uniref:DinB family protein n=1 Tax=Flexivirga sp. TaxID=1962927 RepID=UPI003F7FF8E7
MVTFNASDDLRGARFVGVSLREARFVRSDLSGVVMRSVDVAGTEIDAPWLLEADLSAAAGGSDDGFLRVNGVDVRPLVDAELNRRFPGREQRHAADPDALRSAWSAVEGAWAGAVDRVAAMPAGTADVSIEEEWSFAQTLRHLVMATDTWLRRAILGVSEPYHPIGQPHAEYAADGGDMSVFAESCPSYDRVLEVRAERMAMVRDFLAGLGTDELRTPRSNPWAPHYPETTLSCLHTIIAEEWEHLRYAVRDLDTIDARAGEETGKDQPAGRSPDEGDRQRPRA